VAQTRPKPRRKRANTWILGLRILSAAIPDNSALRSRLLCGQREDRTTLSPTAPIVSWAHRYRHDPRTVGKMAGHILLPWIHRVFAADETLGSDLITAAPQAHRHVSQRVCLPIQSALLPHVSFETMLGSPRTITRRLWDIVRAIIPQKACRQSGAARGAEDKRPACAQTDQDSTKNSKTQPRFGFARQP